MDGDSPGDDSAGDVSAGHDMSRRLAYLVVGSLAALAYLVWVSLAVGFLYLGFDRAAGVAESRRADSGMAVPTTTAPLGTTTPGAATSDPETRDAAGSDPATPSTPGSPSRDPSTIERTPPNPASPGATDGPTRRITATPEAPSRRPALPSGVDWPDLAEVGDRRPRATTAHFAVHADDPDDALLAQTADRWAPEMEAILADVSAKLDGQELPESPVQLVFSRSYTARCPARGLASTSHDPPLIMIFVAPDTPEVQVEAVLAHEMAHHITLDERFVGDGILTEGIANWAADRRMLAWQRYGSWNAAVRDYVVRGGYVSVADPTALNPRPGEDCIARRDRVYNIRTAFVDWLVARIGLERVLAMPYIEVESPGADGAEPEIVKVPDYETATGRRLPVLEWLWLRDVAAPPRPQAGLFRQWSIEHARLAPADSLLTHLDSLLLSPPPSSPPSSWNTP